MEVIADSHRDLQKTHWVLPTLNLLAPSIPGTCKDHVMPAGVYKTEMIEH